ncbi:hypothetical protein HW132_09315 [Brasilonema sp. CT11]|nr:hypothetical protein [Brasilonema sp. CT11]
MSQFQPKIRGRLVDSFQLDLGQVRCSSREPSPCGRSLSFQINRSQQEPDSPIPLEFGLDVGSEVLVTNQE